MASVTDEHRALAAATLRYAATVLSEKEQPGAFWLNELAESFEWGCQDRVLARLVDGYPCCWVGLGAKPPFSRSPRGWWSSTLVAALQSGRTARPGPDER
jgi:hypothetical protein